MKPRFISKKCQLLLTLLLCLLSLNMSAQFSGYGNGTVPSPAISGTFYVDDSRVKANFSSLTKFSINNGSTYFNVGDLALIINMGNCDGNLNWEIQSISDITIASGIQTEIKFVQLAKSYTSSDQLQIIALPQYANFTIPNGATVTCNKWDPVSGTGGVLPLLVKGTLTINGTIDASKTGFGPSTIEGIGGTGGSGGLGGQVAGANGGTTGPGLPATSAGAGNGGKLGGDPTGNSTVRLAGVNQCCGCMEPDVPVEAGIPASNKSNPANKFLMMGGAGQNGNGGFGKIGAGGAGAGCVDSGVPGGDGEAGGNGGNGGKGAAGGGIIFIKSSYIIFGASGSIKSIGENGINGGNGTVGGKGGDAISNYGAGGGFGAEGGGPGYGGSGGAGGMIYIVSTSTVTQNSQIQINGGLKGFGGSPGAAGVFGKTAQPNDSCPGIPFTFFCECDNVWSLMNSATTFVKDSPHNYTFSNPSISTCKIQTAPGILKIVCTDLISNDKYDCTMGEDPSYINATYEYREDHCLEEYLASIPIKQNGPVDCRISCGEISDPPIVYYRNICCPIIGGGEYPVPILNENYDGLPGNSGKFVSNIETNCPDGPVHPPQPPPICTGFDILLTAADGFDHYIWTPGVGLNRTVGQTVYASASGTFTVTSTTDNGCTATSSVIVVVNPTPTPPVITPVGTTTICENGNPAFLLLDATVFDPLLSYQWNDFSETTSEDLTVYGYDPSFPFFGNPYSFNLTATNSYGCSSISNSVSVTLITCNSTSVNVNLRMFIQSFYNPTTGLMDIGHPGQGCFNYVDAGTYPDPNDVDDVTVTAMDESTYLPIESAVGRLKINGDLSVSFSGPATIGNNYYLKVTSRNLVETWSKFPLPFSNSNIAYDFSASSTQAYDDGFTLPMKLVSASPAIWAIYNGDIDQDGGVTSLDMTVEENDSNLGAFGLQSSDLDGDGSSGSLDMTIIENNSNNNIYSSHP